MLNFLPVVKASMSAISKNHYWKDYICEFVKRYNIWEEMEGHLHTWFCPELHAIKKAYNRKLHRNKFQMEWGRNNTAISQPKGIRCLVFSYFGPLLNETFLIVRLYLAWRPCQRQFQFSCTRAHEVLGASMDFAGQMLVKFELTKATSYWSQIFWY